MLVSTRHSQIATIQARTLQAELRQRMSRPQRHRLLHGYPLAAAMPKVESPAHRRALQDDLTTPIEPDLRRLLVGLLPHPFCNPKVAGCGFCTFPHETFGSIRAAGVVKRVLREMDGRVRMTPDLYRRKVDALYLGGGTANLTPAEPFRKLCRTLNSLFDLADAEVTLEGVPAYFVRRKPLLIDILRDEIHARHFRLSMGIQTFSEPRLERMGRLAFGRPDMFGQVVHFAHQHGMTISGDLLFNLPGQSRTEMEQDVRRAVEIDLDHVGLYHLVMFAGLGTPWSNDASLLASLPGNSQAADNWAALRELLRDQGFHQTTLTNFERDELAGDPRRFQYEELSFQPERFDMLGFGPGGISYTQQSADTALKTMNPESSAEYVKAVDAGLGVWNRYFAYQLPDLKILTLTRWLAALRIDRVRYERWFACDVVEDFPAEVAVLQEAGLVDVQERALVPTPRGSFFADSIAALLASRRLRTLRNSIGFDRQVASNAALSADVYRDKGNAYGHI